MGVNDIACRRDILAGSVLRAVFTELFRVFVVHTLLNPAGADECILGIVVQSGVQIDSDRLVLPCTSKVPFALALSEIDHLTAVEDITKRRVCGRSNNGTATLAGILVAWLQRDGGILESDVTTTADEVNGTMDVAVLPISLLLAVRTVVGVLIRQHTHVLADGAITSILQHGSTSGRTSSIVVQCVLQRQIL